MFGCWLCSVVVVVVEEEEEEEKGEVVAAATRSCTLCGDALAWLLRGGRCSLAGAIRCAPSTVTTREVASSSLVAEMWTTFLGTS
jgi:hypothetical protein